MLPSSKTDLANPQTLGDVVRTWQTAEAEVREAHRLLVSTQTRLQNDMAGAGHHFSLFYDLRDLRDDAKGADSLITKLKRQAWRVLVERMEIRRVLSVQRAEDLDKKLESDTMPDITEQEVTAMMHAAFSQINTFVEEAVKEVFEFLRPRGAKYKTNTEFDIGKRVILASRVEQNWTGSGFRVNHYYEKEIRALDNVFHTLDGQGTIKNYRGPLIDAIEATDSGGTGETEYFKFKCHKNRTLHIEFKRLDLVAKLNQIAGGNRLYQERKAA